MKKKITESIALSFRKKWITSRTTTLMIVAILLAGYISLNLGLKTIDLPKFDLTANKLYTLSDDSKKVLSNVNSEVKLYVYGYEESDLFIDFLKQYNECNNSINYEFITTESNVDKLSTYNLETGDRAVIVESNGVNKILLETDFQSYDYVSGKYTDSTENVLTNSILNLTIAEKPRVYFLTGHDEILTDYLQGLQSYLKNSIFEVDTLNLLTKEEVPNDCNLIIAMSPIKDLYAQEYDRLVNYINKGGNIIFTSDFSDKIDANSLVNWQKILDLYGVSIDRAGYVYEASEDSIIDNTPSMFMPQLEYSDLTADIYTNKKIILELAQKINLTEDENTKTELGVEYETLMTSSDKSFYVTDFSENAINSLTSQTPQSYVLGTVATKTINQSNEENSDSKQSKLVVIGNGSFVSDMPSIVLYYTENQKISQCSLANNVDFFINVVAGLTDRKDTVTIIKDINSTTFRPTDNESKTVLAISFGIPVAIILLGVIVWSIRKRKK